MRNDVVYNLANRIAAQVLIQYKDNLRWVTMIPIEKLAAQWGLEQSTNASSENVRFSNYSSGSTHGLKNPTKDFEPETKESMTYPLPLQSSLYQMRIFGSGYGRRFTIAHELAHVVLHNRMKEEEEELSSRMLEYVCELAAGMILVPDSMLWAAYNKSMNFQNKITFLEDISRNLEVSLTVLTNRLGDATRSRLIKMDFGVMMIDLAKSRKTADNLAPRIQTSCLPSGWFIPRNKRLSSLGSQFLPALFAISTPYEENQVRDHLVLWHRSSGTWCELDIIASYKCYLTNDHMRKMLAVIDSAMLQEGDSKLL